MAKEPEPYPLEEITRRHSALRLAQAANAAVMTGVPVTKITTDMIIAYAQRGTIHKITPEASARAARNGGHARAEIFRAQKREREMVES